MMVCVPSGTATTTATHTQKHTHTVHVVYTAAAHMLASVRRRERGGKKREDKCDKWFLLNENTQTCNYFPEPPRNDKDKTNTR